MTGGKGQTTTTTFIPMKLIADDLDLRGGGNTSIVTVSIPFDSPGCCLKPGQTSAVTRMISLGPGVFLVTLWSTTFTRRIPLVDVIPKSSH
jgi:hypothetical protein